MHSEAISSPQHVAIIMDGNGRWAKARNMPRAMGHRQGAETLKKLLGHCLELNIKHLTLYAFSSENWGRPATEVNDLMGLLQLYIEKEAKLLIENKIRLRVIGDTSLLDEKLQGRIQKVVDKTAQFDTLHLTIALSYGSRQEIAHSVRELAENAANGIINLSDITEETIANHLYTRDLPDPDLLIRTGGEQRLSNFLLWQCAYTELYFTETYWPEFTGEHLREAIDAYQRRERRYGTV